MTYITLDIVTGHPRKWSHENRTATNGKVITVDHDSQVTVVSYKVKDGKKVFHHSQMWYGDAMRIVSRYVITNLPSGVYVIADHGLLLTVLEII